MAKYAASGVSAATAIPKTALGVTGAATLRPKIYDILMGSSATPADAQVTYTVQRFTAAGTSTAVTPEPLETGDRAATCTAGQTHTVEPTYAGVAHLILPIHQRASFRWVARQGGEIIIVATAANGVGCKKTAETTGTPAVNCVMHWEE